MGASLKDIAALAGVSVSTVSRVLNEKAYVNIPWTDTNNAVLQTVILTADNKEYNVLLKNTADDRDEVD